MDNSNVIEQISSSLYSALYVDLSLIEYTTFASFSVEDRVNRAMVSKTRRPTITDIEVYTFPQGWPSTAMGFGGVGGQMFCTATTVVILCGREACVYFNGRFAYRIINFNSVLLSDICAHKMEDVQNKHKYYKKTKTKTLKEQRPS